MDGSSINYDAMKKTSRLVREKAFDLPNALRRLEDSVKGDTHLRGRVCRAYLFSSILSLVGGKIFLATRRFFSFLSLSIGYINLKDFWSGLFYNLNNREFS